MACYWQVLEGHLAACDWPGLVGRMAACDWGLGGTCQHVIGQDLGLVRRSGCQARICIAEGGAGGGATAGPALGWAATGGGCRPRVEGERVVGMKWVVNLLGEIGT